LERYGVQPDILTFAKGITSGYIPLGGIGLSDRVYQVLCDAPPAQRWMHAFTYSAHPVGCAVGLAAIDGYEKENLVAAADAKGKKLLAGVKQLSSLSLVGDVRGMGMLVGLELVEDKSTKKAFDPAKKMGERLHRECCSRGLYSRIRGDIYLLAPPFVTTEEQLDRIINILGDSVKALG
jgi:adenosylmethionine-8-amino-7-oxononanoate aminotransferase